MINKTNPKAAIAARIIIWAIIISIYTSESFAPEIIPQANESASNKINEFQVKILSWNIAMLPIFDFVHSGRDRATTIGRALQNSDYDIIVFQEAFSPIARHAIYNKLRKYFPFNYGPANASPALKINSGLWILSRLPLSIVKEYKFSGCQGFDCLSRKGAIILEGKCKDQPFQLIGTHLESDASDVAVRMTQLHELYDSVISPFSNPEIPQIICGDFNTDKELTSQYVNMLKILKCEDGSLSGDEKITFGFPLNQEATESHQKPRQLDYILTKNSQLLDLIKRKITVIHEEMTNRYVCLSDHYGIEATIQFKPVISISGGSQ